MKRSVIPRGKSKVQACCCNHGNRSRSGRPGTSSEAGQIGRSATLLHAALHRQGAGQRMLTLPPRPSLLAVTPATITLAMACQEERGSSGGTIFDKYVTIFILIRETCCLNLKKVYLSRSHLCTDHRLHDSSSHRTRRCPHVYLPSLQRDLHHNNYTLHTHRSLTARANTNTQHVNALCVDASLYVFSTRSLNKSATWAGT